MRKDRKKPRLTLSLSVRFLFFATLVAMFAGVSWSGSARINEAEFQGQQINKAQVSPPELILQSGHSMKVIAVAMSPDNRVIASASADNTINLWDAVGGNQLRTFSGHEGWVKALAFSGDGKFLASGSNDRTVRVWEVETGREILSLKGHSAPVETVSFNNDGSKLVSGSADQTLRLWESATGRELSLLKGHTDWVTCATFSADSKFMVSGGRDSTVRIWDLATNLESKVLKGHTDRIRSLVFSPDGKSLATSSSDSSVKLWRTSDWKETRTLKGTRAIISVAYSVDGKQLFGAGDNGVITSWNVVTGRASSAFGDETKIDLVESVAFSSDAGLFAASSDKTVELYDLTNGTRVHLFDSRAAGFYAVAYSPNGRWLASGAKDRTVRLWDTATGREMPPLVGHTGYVTSIAFSNDDRLIASVSLDRTARVWETTTGQQIKRLEGHEGNIDTVAFSADNKFLATGSYDKTVRIWNLKDGVETRRLMGHQGEVTSVAFSRDGKWLASGCIDKTIRIWDATNWNEVRVIDVGLPVNTLAFSPDNKSLAVGASEMTIKFVDLASGEIGKTVKSEPGDVRGLAFTRDGRKLAAACSDETIRLYDVATLGVPKVLKGHSGSVNAVDFNADGKWLFSGSEDGTIVVWNTESTNKLATLMSFSKSNEWIVVTPDGLFDGSPVAWHQILWRFSGNTFNIAPVESFFSEFFHPGLLADILSNKNPVAPQNIALKDRRQPQLKLRTESATTASTATRTVSIKIDLVEASADNVTHKTGSGIRDVRLFRNGSLVKVWRGDVALDSAGKGSVETTVSLAAGENKLTAYAFNRDNIKSGDVALNVVGSDALKRQGTAYVLVVGVNQYQNSEFNLRYAVPDAQDFGAEFQQAQQQLGNYQKVEIVPLLDNLATKSNILLALSRLAVGSSSLPPAAPKVLEKLQVAQPEDAVVVYFAGHGTATSDGRFYLIPHDLGYDGPRTDLGALGRQSILSNGLSDQELERAFEQIDGGQFLLVVDACNSGQVLEAEEKRRGPMNSKGLAQLAYEKGIHILTAAQSYQAALEQRQLGHGYLTYALVEEGLKTAAADVKPKDGMISITEWLDYAVHRVPTIQIAGAKDTQGRLLEHEDPKRVAKERDVQRPAVFYRLGIDGTPLIVAKVRAGGVSGQ